jgi:phosphoribosyl 1,2-cyclic phosphodiesterase
METMTVTCWGTRGSIPVSGPQFVRHGGATTCVEVTCGAQRFIIDCGSGLAELGRTRGFALKDAIILQTHMHWDHVQGFPFFTPLFNKDARFELWAVDRGDKPLEQILREQMTAPTFPISLDMIPAALDFVRIDFNGASVMFTGDAEVQLGGREALLELARGVDVLIMDAQYMPHEYEARRGWGHSTPLDAVSLARDANVAHLLLTHHDPAHDDLRLADKLTLAREAAGGHLVVDNAYDRLCLQPGGYVHRGAA